MPADPVQPMRLGGLYRYPLKSGAAQACDVLAVEPRGLSGDRRWMVCDPAGRFVTGRSHPRLSLVSAVPDPAGLQLQAPGMPALHVAFPALDKRREVQVWKQAVPACIGDLAADAWLSRWLGTPVQLAWLPEDSHRPLDARYGRDGDEVSFADGFPLLLLAQASVEALNRRLRQPVGALHFRPNLVIADARPHAEDGWRHVRIGEILFEVAKPCTRCVFVNVDPHTAVADPDGEPLRTLAGYRRAPKGIVFGQNLIPRGGGVLRLGDPVIPLD